jgi:hypothetical protein
MLRNLGSNLPKLKRSPRYGLSGLTVNGAPCIEKGLGLKPAGRRIWRSTLLGAPKATAFD